MSTIDPLAGVDPRLLERLRAEGLGREEILSRVGLLESVTHKELQKAIEAKPELLEPAKRAHMEEKIRDAVVREMSATPLAATASVEAYKERLLEAARRAAAASGTSSSRG